MDIISFMISYLIPIMMMLGIGMISAYNHHSRTFDENTFLLVISICIPMLIWVGVFPVYTIAITGLCIAGILVRGDTANE